MRRLTLVIGDVGNEPGTHLIPENFERIFGEDYRTYVAEFEDFIRTNDREAVMGILPRS